MMISVTDANKNFSKATRIADEEGQALILKGLLESALYNYKHKERFCPTFSGESFFGILLQ